ncbi:MAG: dienelactone hydrolase family protein [Luteolibacter sp.]|uniref:dienelactone hydrolase family protein n=1 Tax=Luteolibacter sp. TaxID=1962973 RepID=UPI003266FAA7
MRCFLVLLFAANAWAAPAADVSLSRAQAEKLRDTLAAETLATLKTERAAEVAAKSITVGDKTLRWLEKEFGEAPEGKRSLWISMHGGGNGPAEMNDQQWQNQIKLYQPKEGIYLAPRAPTNTWNLWHEVHVDPLFDRLIADMIATRGVDPNRVYLMGYSAGGDGVWQLAPRMADRFAAAAMMAGHPNEASLLGLRNLPFAIFVGGADAAYDRNKIDAKKGEELDTLQKADPKGYEHFVKVYEGLPHWMNGKDAEAVPWMAEHTRNPWPDQIVWFQDDVTHDQFYWLEIPPGSAKAGQKIIATAKGNEITLDGDVPKGITLRLSDALVNLDKEITVKINGAQAFRGIVKRAPEAISEALKSRPDAALCPLAKLRLDP